MPKRLAITIAGAVSLGSYEAGVAYELLEAVRTHNQQPGLDADDKIYIDTITGASAGGMTAAMLAQRLMFDGAAMGMGDGDACAFTNPLYHAWVERISLQGLVKLRPGEKRWNSLFSSDLIAEIGTEMLVHSMAAGKLRSGVHAAIEADAPTPLRLGVAITNLNGVDYMLPIAGSDEDGFHYTRSVDQITAPLTFASEQDLPLWNHLRDAAVGCGAFPVAFRPRAIVRSVAEYGTPTPSPLPVPPTGETYIDWGSRKPTMPFAFTDGGVLQNQPLGLAKNLIDDRVAEYESLGRFAEADSLADDRLYVFVSPNAVQSSSDKLVAGKITMGKIVVELFHTYLRQAMFHDWIVAEGMNEKVRVLDARAAELAQCLIDGSVTPGNLVAAADQLNELMLGAGKQRTLDRLEHQYGHLYAGVLAAKGEAVADAFVAAMATLEAAAQLGARDKMKIVAVIADGRTELAGSGVSAFAGFFDRSYREHDYWVGRVKTRVYLQRSDVKNILGVGKWPQEDRWGGATEDKVAAVLKNPTAITAADLPLKPGTYLRPAWRHLWTVVRLRPALWIVPLLVLLVSMALLGALVWLLVLLHRR